MAADDNKNMFRNFIDEVWNQHNIDALDNYYSDNHVEHTPFGEFSGSDELRGFVSMHLRGFPDFSVTIHNIIAEGDHLAAYYTTSGTHQNEYLGVEATGKKIDVDGCYMCRIENGEFVEGWNQFDVMAILMTMELVTPDMLGGMEQMSGMRGGSRA